MRSEREVSGGRRCASRNQSLQERFSSLRPDSSDSLHFVKTVEENWLYSQRLREMVASVRSREHQGKRGRALTVPQVCELVEVEVV